MNKIKGFLQPWENIELEFEQAIQHFKDNSVLLWGKGSYQGKNAKKVFVRSLGENWKLIVGMFDVEKFDPPREEYNLDINEFISGSFKGMKCMPDEWLKNGGELFEKYFLLTNPCDLRPLNLRLEGDLKIFENPCNVEINIKVEKG